MPRVPGADGPDRDDALIGQTSHAVSGAISPQQMRLASVPARQRTSANRMAAPPAPSGPPTAGAPPIWWRLAEDTLCDCGAMRCLAGIALGDDRIPDEITILGIRHLPKRHRLSEAIFANVNAHLADQGITLRSDSLLDASIIDTPSSTRTKAGACDPGISFTKKATAGSSA